MKKLYCLYIILTDREKLRFCNIIDMSHAHYSENRSIKTINGKIKGPDIWFRCVGFTSNKKLFLKYINTKNLDHFIVRIIKDSDEIYEFEEAYKELEIKNRKIIPTEDAIDYGYDDQSKYILPLSKKECDEFVMDTLPYFMVFLEDYLRLDPRMFQGKIREFLDNTMYTYYHLGVYSDDCEEISSELDILDWNASYSPYGRSSFKNILGIYIIVYDKLINAENILKTVRIE